VASDRACAARELIGQTRRIRSPLRAHRQEDSPSAPGITIGKDDPPWQPGWRGFGGVRAPAVVLAILVLFGLLGCGSSAGGSETSASTSSSAAERSDIAKKAGLGGPKEASGTGRLKSVGIVTGGHPRTYLLYVPPGDSSQHRLPLVLVYHGADDTAVATSTETSLLSIAERQHNMILVFMQGYHDTWNEGAGHTPAEQAGINDVTFTSTVLRRVESNYDVDPRRVVATGLSNGALLTELLGCKLSANLTLIVPVEGQLPVTVSSGCRPNTPVSVFEIHGTADQVIPYGGGSFAGVGGGTTVLSAPASVQRWATLDHCGATGRRSRSGNVSFTRYTGCRQAVTVTLASIQGGQHQWPSGFGQDLVGVMNSLPTTRRAVAA